MYNSSLLVFYRRNNLRAVLNECIQKPTVTSWLIGSRQKIYFKRLRILLKYEFFYVSNINFNNPISMKLLI